MIGIPACHRQAGVLWVATVCLAVSAGDVAPPAPAGLPRVPTRAAILKDQPNESKRVTEWVQAFMDAKERKAQLELDVIRKTVQAEEAKRLEEERERRRREENYKRSIGEYVPVRKNEEGSSKIKLDFQVPEIDSYRAVSDVCLQHKALADSISDYLSRLDRDGDGKLTADDYNDAGAVFVGAAKLLTPMDSNGDGQLGEDELEAARKLPRNAATALRGGRAVSEVPSFRIKGFDKDANGELRTDEHKAMVMAYVEASLRFESDAAFYKNLADSLTQARAVSASRYAELELNPVAPAPGPAPAPPR